MKYALTTYFNSPAVIVGGPCALNIRPALEQIGISKVGYVITSFRNLTGWRGHDLHLVILVVSQLNIQRCKLCHFVQGTYWLSFSRGLYECCAVLIWKNEYISDIMRKKTFMISENICRAPWEGGPVGTLFRGLMVWRIETQEIVLHRTVKFLSEAINVYEEVEEYFGQTS